MSTTIETLKELGMDEAARVTGKRLSQAKKMTVAYENYRFISPLIFSRFNQELRKKTEKNDKRGAAYGSSYDKLRLTPLKSWKTVPPVEALEKLREAKSRGCFDSFEVADIETVTVRPDPIIFGTIEGCADKFYVAQWDTDVKIEDILRNGEG